MEHDQTRKRTAISEAPAPVVPITLRGISDPVGLALFKITYGLYIVTSRLGERLNGQCCNTLFQITENPRRIAIGINKKNLTYEYITKSGVFATTVLGTDGHPLVGRFGYRSGREIDKFAGLSYLLAEHTGCPVVLPGIAFIECRVRPEMTVDAGTHSLFVADVLGAGILHDGEPLTYAYYRATKSLVPQTYKG
ncbi:MAG TPA: flavin reductase family protein [Firmicutes bacterium]|nr:flavin reductase family protein [Bacillota bacterium]